uniref:Uncharacterized protein n=1 Tax=Arundo donax TaxID=35708 RepID=A0A0A9CVC4_ARUDO
MDEAAAAHEAWQEHRIRFQEYVRSEYEAKGYVEVSEEYIAKRIEVEEYSKKLWEEGFADFDNVKEEVVQ